MREIQVKDIIKAVKQLCIDANYFLGKDVLAAFDKAVDTEASETGKEILRQLIENARIAREEEVPMCQDTGFAVLFVELGQDLHIVGGSFYEALQEGVRQGYAEGYLRKSILADPIRRKNTGDNTPAVIHTEIVPGDHLKIIVAPKGGGSENMSRVMMLSPSDGIEGVKNFVIERVRQSGPNPCPPIIVGVGLGGTFEKCAYLAKKALLRPLNQPNPDPFYAEVEADLLEKVNKLGIGPAGLGGYVTALAVHIEVFPCHLASLPVAVNINCHAHRHKEITL